MQINDLYKNYFSFVSNLVSKQCEKHSLKINDSEDLIQEIFIQLIKAEKRGYDLNNKNVKFLLWIIATRAINKHLHSFFKKHIKEDDISKYEEKLFSENGFENMIEVLNKNQEDDIPEYKEEIFEIFSETNLDNTIITIAQELSEEMIKYLKTNPRELYNIHWRVFEELIAEILKSFGWSVELTAPSCDGGYDIFAIHNDKSGLSHNWIIECKKYKQEKILGINYVRELYGVKTDLRIGNALLATTSHFSKSAHDFKTSHYDFELKDFEGIVDWLNKYKFNKKGKLWISDNKLFKK